MSESELIRTGIAGFDSILLGGIPKGNVILLQGVTGSGKTLMGLEFIYRGITEFDEPGLVVVFETSPDKLIRDAAGFGWNLEELQQRKKLQIIFSNPQVFDQELRSPDSLLLETATEMGARRIFVDGIGLLNSPPVLDSSGGSQFRERLQQLMESFGRENLTAILSLELGSARESIAAAEMTDFLADTVIQLGCVRNGRCVRRSLEVLKSRGQDFDSGEHTLQITANKGLQVYRRVQAPLRTNLTQPTSSTMQSVIGVEAVDTLIGGGVFDGSTTMVVGVSGVGKTVLGTQILQQGALKQKTRGLLISLDEHPEQIVRNAQTLGLNLEDQIAEGTIKILFQSPQELDVDSHYARIIQAIEEHGIQRMVIDGMTSYSTAIGDLGVYRDFFHAIVAYISVVKSRGSKHSFDTREFVIGQGGISLVPLEKSAT